MNIQHAERTALGMQASSIHDKAMQNRDWAMNPRDLATGRRPRRGSRGKAKHKVWNGTEWMEVVPPTRDQSKRTKACKPAPPKVSMWHYAYVLGSESDDNWSSQGTLTFTGEAPPTDLAAWVWSEVGGACAPTVTVKNVALINKV